MANKYIIYIITNHFSLLCSIIGKAKCVWSVLLIIAEDTENRFDDCDYDDDDVDYSSEDDENVTTKVL